MIFSEYQTDSADFEIYEREESKGDGVLRATLSRNHGSKRINIRLVDVDSGGEVAKMFTTDYFEAATIAKCYVLGISSPELRRMEEVRREVEKMATMCKIF